MGNLKIKKVCGFNISSIHFSMMILPYIKNEIKTEKNVITILETNLDKNIDQILSKLTITDEEKKKILNINWESTDIRGLDFEKNVREKIEESDDIDIIVYGNDEYINNVLETINKVINNIFNKVKKIKIINCYSVKNFNENIKEILDKHDVVFNTSGEHQIAEVFQGYKKTS